MKIKTSTATNRSKVRTGIDGFDEITHGGLPRGRTSLLVGGPGSGKTLFGLRFSVHGAQECEEPGIFVAFEERSKRIVANAEVFGWNLPKLQRKALFFLDAQPSKALTWLYNEDLKPLSLAKTASTISGGQYQKTLQTPHPSPRTLMPA
jgi:circadian clock protein KaiC